MRVARELQDRIAAGAFADNTLPTEHQLASDYKMSRVTIRKALGYLEERGIIHRRQGKGTFVNPGHMHHFSGRAQTIVEALRAEGTEPDVTVLGLEHCRLPDEIAALFGTGTQDGAILRRLYSHQGEAIALVTLYLPLSMSGVAHILAQDENRRETTYSVFERQMGLTIKEAKHVIKTVRVAEEEARHLGVNPDEVCLAMDRITYSSQGAVMELMSYVYAPDRMQFEVTLPRDPHGAVLKLRPGE
jgi:GntR family transcriptional regulator